MRSTNPVFTRSESFSTAQPTYRAPGQQAPEYGYGQQQWDTQFPQQQYTPEHPGTGVMTIDDVITKSAITMGVLFLSAALTFMFIPPALMMPALIGSGIVGFITVLFVAMRRTVNPAAVLAYSVIEGVFIGAFSLYFELMFPGIVVQAIFATFVAAAVTFGAYKFLNVRVTGKLAKVVTITTIAFAAVMLINFVLALMGINLGLRGFGPLAMIVSLIAIALAVFNLLMDFDYIEQGIRNRLPASESWRGAFGLTVTMVWLYTELLRIIAIFRSN